MALRLMLQWMAPYPCIWGGTEKSQWVKKMTWSWAGGRWERSKRSWEEGWGDNIKIYSIHLWNSQRINGEHYLKVNISLKLFYWQQCYPKHIFLPSFLQYNLIFDIVIDGFILNSDFSDIHFFIGHHIWKRSLKKKLDPNEGYTALTELKYSF